MKANRFLGALLLAGSFSALPLVAGCHDGCFSGISDGKGGVHQWVSSGFGPSVRGCPFGRPALTRRASLSGFRTTAPPGLPC